MRLFASHSNSPSGATPSSLTLRLPGVLDVGRVLVEDLAQQAPALPGLEQLLARGERLADDTSRLAAPAALGLLGEGGEPGGAYWLRADPVHLHPDQDHLLLWDAAVLSLTREESESLVASFNAHFGEDGYELQAPAPGRWYLRVPESLSVTTTPVADATGRNVGHFMPAGPDAVRLERLINETQMLFHDHPVNRERAAVGALSVNGVWPWGGGRLSEGGATPDAGRWGSVHADDPVMRGWARHHDLAVHPVPRDFAEWQGAAAGASLVVTDTGAFEARQGDGPGWQQALETLERDWFRPAVAAVFRGQLPELVVAMPPLGRWRLRRAMRWRLWRRRRPLWDRLSAVDAGPADGRQG